MSFPKTESQVFNLPRKSQSLPHCFQLELILWSSVLALWFLNQRWMRSKCRFGHKLDHLQHPLSMLWSFFCSLVINTSSTGLKNQRTKICTLRYCTNCSGSYHSPNNLPLAGFLTLTAHRPHTSQVYVTSWLVLLACWPLLAVPSATRMILQQCSRTPATSPRPDSSRSCCDADLHVGPARRAGRHWRSNTSSHIAPVESLLPECH